MPDDLSTETHIALIEKDIAQIRESMVEMRVAMNEKIGDVAESINTIRTYFYRMLFSLAGIVGIYFVEWIIKGGLNVSSGVQ